MRLLFLLSGEHPTLPFSELACVGKIIEAERQVAVAECDSVAGAGRLAMTHSVMEYMGECDADLSSLRHLLKDLAISTDATYAARATRIEGTRIKEPSTVLEHTMGKLISGTVCLSGPEEVYRAVCSGDRCYIGRVLANPDRSSYEQRKPGGRAFFHPGVMMPRLARTLVNISLASPGDWLYDPFCGTGGILLEATGIGVMAAGGDMDLMMVQGTRSNLPGSMCIRADACKMPLRSGSVDAVVTDLPYGQSVAIMGSGMEFLYEHALLEIRRIIRPGRRAVIVTHRDIRDIASGIMPLIEFHEQRVHKSLTRRIMVMTS
jgi:tRNA (guanine10-N2)-dimethyltransferase